MAVETTHLTKEFDGQTAVDDVNLRVERGTIYGVVGANGAGKSTLLRMLIGLFRPTFGEVRLLGEPVTVESSQIRQRVHYVGADGELSRTFRVSDLLHYASLLYDRWDSARCQALIEGLGLPQDKLIRNLSLGMKMQLRLAVALATHPEVLILDEPTNGLDPVVKRQFLQLLVQQAASDGATIVLATHQLDDLDRIADGVAVMYQGRLVASGMLDDLKNRVKEVQVVVNGEGISDDIRHVPGVIRIDNRGQVYTIVVDDHVDELTQRLQSAGATHIEVLDLGFDELFRYFMEKEGYTREGILLP